MVQPFRPLHLLSLLALACLLPSGCGPSVAEPPPPEVSGETIAKVAQAEQQFALHLYARMTEETEGENLFFSPHSVYSVLSMVAEGADGETAEQMAKVLGLEKEEGASQFLSTHQGLAGLAYGLKGRGNSKDQHTLLTANALWLDKSFPIAPSYSQALDPYLNGGGGIFPCDFANRYTVEANRIDQWCADNTKGRITSIMPKKSPQEASLLKLVLTNAVFFEGKWVKPFEPKDTEKRDFTLADGSEVKVDTMLTRNFSEGRYGAVDAEGKWFTTPTTYDPTRPTDEQNLYPEGKGFTMAELPYKGGRLSMLLVAPRAADGLPHVEKLLTPERLAEWVGKLESRSMSWVKMPKLNLATTYNMTQMLADLGMELAFTPPSGNEGADFSRMTASSDPNAQLYLSMVLHKATLEVDEQGTVAAAVTAGLMETASAAVQQTRPFHPAFEADRPFLLLIRDNQSGDILFMGRVNDPR
jgi:serpin B